DVGGAGGPLGGEGSLVTGGGDVGDALVAGGGGEGGVVGDLAAEFTAAPAHRDDRHAGQAARGVDGGEQVAGRVVVRHHQVDRGAGGDGMGPLNVERDFAGPTAVGLYRAAAAALLVVQVDDGVS